MIIGLGSKLQVMQAKQVRNITSYNEIDLELPGKQKCAYFCIVSDQDNTFDFLSSLLLQLSVHQAHPATPTATAKGGVLKPKGEIHLG